jgi:hypothetical protein
MANVQEIYSYAPFAATGVVKGAPCVLAGILVSSSTGGTIAVYDSATAGVSNPVVAAMPVVAGSYYPIPVGLGNGLYIVVGGALTATAFIG